MKQAAILTLSFIISTCVPPANTSELTESESPSFWDYPTARQGNTVEDYHGTDVADPYRWLEDPDAVETVGWVAAQNELTRSYLDAIPARKKFEARLTELWNYPKYGVPEHYGNWYYYSKNDGLQDQSVYYRARSLSDEPEIVLDPNTFSDDGTIALSGTYFSADGRYMTYGKSVGGSDWKEIFVRDLLSNSDLDEKISLTRTSRSTWKKDNSGFYYVKYPNGARDMTVDQTSNSKVYFHRIGTSESENREIYRYPENETYSNYPWVTEDGEYLVIELYDGTDIRNGILVRRDEEEGPFTTLFEVGEAEFTLIGNIGSLFYFKTTLDAPKGRIFTLDLESPDRSNWKTIIPESDDVINSASLVGGKLALRYMHNAHEQVKIFDTAGHLVHDVALPSMGKIYSWWGLEAVGADEVYFTFASFFYPSSAMRLNLTTGKINQVWESEIDFNPDDYITTQVWYPSKDGTPVSMFLNHRKGLKQDGTNHTILYGYGGFNIPILPWFNIGHLVWMESGGIFAVANLRGGGEYGEEWHEGGMLGNRQNVYDDFIAAGEWLISNDYTSPMKLAIDGASGGGLLVAVALVQRPNLFGAALPRVPVIDMLRYHLFTAGRYWTGEFGNAIENPDHFKFMYAYSPLHNIQEGVAYPPTLITTADTDDRVVSMHSKKFAATLQAKDTGKNPILIRIETKAGHGAGKPTSKRISEYADLYGFLFKALDVTYE